jgi:NAD(P)H-hydrate epimerase
MKILTTSELRKADQFTIDNEPITSYDLMERAGMNLANYISKDLDLNHKKLQIICGTGNNGGDGLVIARQLKSKNINIQIVIIELGKRSSDFDANLQKVENLDILQINESNIQELICDGDFIIDAIFGSGLNKPITGWIKSVINKINESESFRIAIDIPSGLFGEDNALNDQEAIVIANTTYTIQCPKLSFFFKENAHYLGEWKVVDIALNTKFIEQTSSRNYWIDKDIIAGIYRKRNRHSHKGNYGHALLFSGSEGKYGAALLSTKACLKAGAGLVTAAIPKNGNSSLFTYCPEAMVIASGDNYLHACPNLDPYKAIGVGPGIGTRIETSNALKSLIQQSQGNIVFDADALNIISDNPTWLSFLPSGCILTPHPGEFERLCKEKLTAYSRMNKALMLAKKWNVIIILKDAFTMICTPSGNVLMSTQGNQGMATGGSGDVLTGILTSLLAQGYTPLETSILGVYIHGLSANISLGHNSFESITAGTIIEHLGEAFKEVNNYI